MQGTFLSIESPRPSCPSSDIRAKLPATTKNRYHNKFSHFTCGKTESRDTYLAVLVPSPAEDLPFICRNFMTVLESTKKRQGIPRFWGHHT
jgi:hypothetical protein